MYEKILNDSEFLDMMKQIDNIHFITSGKWDWEHGLGHATRVTNYIKQILTALKVDNKTLELGMIAGILHDIGLIKGEKKDHAKYSAELVNKYLSKYNMEQTDIDMIVQAIFDHSNGDNIQSLIGAALLLADKIDISKYRVLNSSIKDELNNQIANIDDVDINITDNEIAINYIANDKFNIKILNDWKKAILVPIKVAAFLQKKCLFLINGKLYDLREL